MINSKAFCSFDCCARFFLTILIYYYELFTIYIFYHYIFVMCIEKMCIKDDDDDLKTAFQLLLISAQMKIIQ